MLLGEPTSPACRRFWTDADDIVVCRILYVEAAAALAQAARLGRVDDTGHGRAVAMLDELWSEADVIDVDDELVRAAADLARTQGLRGYDALHCAAAATLADDDLVAAAGDRALLRAWRDVGVATYDTSEERSWSGPEDVREGARSVGQARSVPGQ